ncbi:MAG: hypothetical protein LC804_28615 [Acidobacteria bacterium]|nr:hypothetical protein [Acidobacteriota bacterium]
MNVRLLLPVVIATSLALSYHRGSSQDLPLGLENPPSPSPVDPGPDAALVRVRIIDSTSKETTSATVTINQGNQEPDNDRYRQFSLRLSGNRHKGPIRSRKIPYYFFTDGRFEVRVPPGPVSIHVRKGYEYRPVDVTLAAGRKETTDVEIVLERAIDMAALGWYSGDTHIHMERTGANDEALLTVTSAKDIRYGYLLSYNTRGYDHGGPRYESSRQHIGLGDRSIARRGPYHIASGQEYRADGLGHVTLALPDRYVPANGVANDTSQGPSMAVIADQAHALNGFIGLAHGGYANQEADRLLLEAKMDYLELLQFGTYRSLGLAGWYDFLNIGYRLPMVGASDYPPTRELASEMTYVWSETVPTPRTHQSRVCLCGWRSTVQCRQRAPNHRAARWLDRGQPGPRSHRATRDAETGDAQSDRHAADRPPAAAGDALTAFMRIPIRSIARNHENHLLALFADDAAGVVKPAT